MINLQETFSIRSLPEHRSESLAVPCPLLPAAAQICHCQEIHGRLRNAGKRSEGPDSRTSRPKAEGSRWRSPLQER